MAYSKVKITIVEKSKNRFNRTVDTPTDYVFEIWNGRPQLPRPILDKTTRLGAEKFVMSVQRTEAVTTNSTAVILGTTTEEVETKCEGLLNSIGKRGTWTDEAGNTIENFYILDVGYAIKSIVNGTNTAMASISIACSCDLAS